MLKTAQILKNQTTLDLSIKITLQLAISYWLSKLMHLTTGIAFKLNGLNKSWYKLPLSAN